MAGPAPTRGPKIGDAASLWNFTPAPGWTKSEVQTLKLCLMKYGVGKWVQILESGLLPGKLIQQLNGQTQRLVGQQSLAALSGLRLDVDAVRADNEARADAPRKQGLIINTGPNLTKEARERLQAEARARYGLSPEQEAQVDAALAALAAEQAAARAAAGGAAADAALLAGDAAALDRAAKLDLLGRLHARLGALAAGLADAEARAAGTGAAVALGRAAGGGGGGDEPRGAGVGAAAAAARTARVGGGAKRKAPGGGGRAKAPAAAAAAPRGGRRRQQQASDDDDDEGGGGAAAGARAAAAADVAAASVAQLAAMGFSARQAAEALEEAGGDADAAAEWLVTNCV